MTLAKPFWVVGNSIMSEIQFLHPGQSSIKFPEVSPATKHHWLATLNTSEMSVVPANMAHLVLKL